MRDRTELDALLDAALVVHVGVVDTSHSPPQPFVVPLASVRDGDRLLVHGSHASRAFRLLATGVPSCATVTIVDGVVVARSQFQSSMRYRSAMLLGSFHPVEGADHVHALQVLTAALLPGLDGARSPSASELAATSMLAMPIQEWSLKVSAGHPDDAPSDLDRAVWAGTVPLHHVWGTPEPAPDLAEGLPVPDAVGRWSPGRA